MKNHRKTATPAVKSVEPASVGNTGQRQINDQRPEALRQQSLQRAIKGSKVQSQQQEKINTLQRKPNKTGLPDQLKSGIENLSGISMDQVKVHYGSSLPTQLNALAYAQGSDIHVAPGQEKHLPHEAWHIVQQQQGRVKPTLQSGGVPINDDPGLEKEADIMGGRALQMKEVNYQKALQKVESSFSGSKPVQGIFIYNVDASTYKIKDSQYYRINSKLKFLTGNKQMKHVTADSTQQGMWAAMEGLTLDAFGQRLVDIATQYKNMPGMKLFDFHPLLGYTPEESGLTDILVENFDLFTTALNNMDQIKGAIPALISNFQKAIQKNDKDGAAFQLQSACTDLVRVLEEVRDLMPLVNIISGAQIRGKEKEALKVLRGEEDGDELAAIWHMFDFAAIDELMGEYDNMDTLNKLIKDCIPWLDVDKVLDILEYDIEEANMETVAHYIAALMLQNHIEFIKLSYPQQALRAQIEKKSVMKSVLDENDVPVNRKTLFGFMKLS